MQRAVYGRTVALAAIESSRADAAANPANLTNATARAEDATRFLHQGHAPEVVKAEALNGSSAIAGVIDDRLGRNGPMGVALFRQYGDCFDPRDRSRHGAAAETLSNTRGAATWARDRSAKPPARRAARPRRPVMQPSMR